MTDEPNWSNKLNQIVSVIFYFFKILVGFLRQKANKANAKWIKNQENAWGSLDVKHHHKKGMTTDLHHGQPIGPPVPKTNALLTLPFPGPLNMQIISLIECLTFGQTLGAWS